MYTCHFWDNNLSTKCSITSIYGKHTGSERKELWKDISDNVISDHLWILGGDFNAICSLEEHQGLTTPTLADITDFKDCIEAIPLICPAFEGGIFTWSGVRSMGRIWRRLDRALVNPLTMNHFPEINMKHLSKTSSDHKPILLQCQLEDFKGAKPFRCQDFWFTHNNFLKVVKDNWTQQPMIGGMRGLVIKLKGLKATLKNWSRETFGDIFEAVKEAEFKAMKAQEEYEENPVDILRSIANKAQADLIVATNRETLFWKQKANIKWMELGDQNSSFFHSYVKSRRSNLKIRSITDGNGRKKMEVEEMRKAAEDYFKEVFSTHKEVHAHHILEYIPNLITPEDNFMMGRIPDEAEIQKAVWDLSPTSSAGPDGFNGSFFRVCWSIIKENVIKATQEFFLGVPIPMAFGSTLITLIPKKKVCKHFSDYRPISLSTFMSKINSRILASRLQTLLSKLISKEQAGFQKGMGVDDHILMTCEMVHSLDKHCDSGNAIIKLDMAKAFDKIEWSVLKGVLKRFGFSQSVQDLLLANLIGTHISILINGCPTETFSPTMGDEMQLEYTVGYILRGRGYMVSVQRGIGTQVNLQRRRGRL
ncbi:unnamed protein product [Cuscuta campestris]|uniref:Uncharacterized protein n=1 Tax=Cuscuta campestris TaxID=132261 RepID=A0A484KJL1_9ASTE|nr:unnamed protein product [Cuscuta campestris]